jgi:hypothetical protein
VERRTKAGPVRYALHAHAVSGSGIHLFYAGTSRRGVFRRHIVLVCSFLSFASQSLSHHLRHDRAMRPAIGSRNLGNGHALNFQQVPQVLYRWVLLHAFPNKFFR